MDILWTRTLLVEQRFGKANMISRSLSEIIRSLLIERFFTLVTLGSCETYAR